MKMVLVEGDYKFRWSVAEYTSSSAVQLVLMTSIASAFTYILYPEILCALAVLFYRYRRILLYYSPPENPKISFFQIWKLEVASRTCRPHNAKVKAPSRMIGQLFDPATPTERTISLVKALEYYFTPFTNVHELSSPVDSCGWYILL